MVQNDDMVSTDDIGFDVNDRGRAGVYLRHNRLDCNDVLRKFGWEEFSVERG